MLFKGQVKNMHCDHMASGCDRTIELMVLRKICETMVHFTGQDELLQRTLSVLENNLGLIHGTVLLVCFVVHVIPRSEPVTYRELCRAFLALSGLASLP